MVESEFDIIVRNVVFGIDMSEPREWIGVELKIGDMEYVRVVRAEYGKESSTMVLTVRSV